ncbi:glutaredoxin domain-containing protein [Clostridium celatum]|uniref:glutaredoxin domain-containing protein n=1 Tax=Clostridium celatum TaxID=36834 RepID=UPI002902A7DC|nr:glutaredoxin domain-containing protein [Clostridium celatum]MDU2266775.1 glutaredoxin domain-containing protein [Clostridium celatum]MDU6297238.1 glutaredoxin domain-containing protein [Clostridium celatum]
MKKFINIAITLILIFSFVGCNQYTRDNTSGSITEINLDEALTIAKEESETILLFTLSTCKDCKKMKEVLTPYLENHSVEINEVILDKEGTSDEEVQNNRRKINTVFEDFNSVPSMYYLKDGEIIDEIFEITEEEQLEEWVVKNKLDKK